MERGFKSAHSLAVGTSIDEARLGSACQVTSEVLDGFRSELGPVLPHQTTETFPEWMFCGQGHRKQPSQPIL